LLIFTIFTRIVVPRAIQASNAVSRYVRAQSFGISNSHSNTCPVRKVYFITAASHIETIRCYAIRSN